MRHHVKGWSVVASSSRWPGCAMSTPSKSTRCPSKSQFPDDAPRKTARYEDVLQDKNVDAVIIATPHHWHAPIALQAMAEGKDVYIEKPISHVYNEGPAIIQRPRSMGASCNKAARCAAARSPSRPASCSTKESSAKSRSPGRGPLKCDKS